MLPLPGAGKVWRQPSEASWFPEGLAAPYPVAYNPPGPTEVERRSEPAHPLGAGTARLARSSHGAAHSDPRLPRARADFERNRADSAKARARNLGAENRRLRGG